MFPSDFEETMWHNRGFAGRLELHVSSGIHWLCGLGQVGSLQPQFCSFVKMGVKLLYVCLCVCVQ